jgi:hypothetical protein
MRQKKNRETKEGNKKAWLIQESNPQAKKEGMSLDSSLGL